MIAEETKKEKAGLMPAFFIYPLQLVHSYQWKSSVSLGQHCAFSKGP